MSEVNNINKDLFKFDTDELLDSEYIEDICEIADYYGMEALTEEQQHLMLHKEDNEYIIDLCMRAREHGLSSLSEEDQFILENLEDRDLYDSFKW